MLTGSSSYAIYHRGRKNAAAAAPVVQSRVAPIFADAWDGPTGVSVNARTDNGKWTYDGDTSHTLLAVVDAVTEGVSSGCPSPQCLKVAHTQSAGSVFSGQVGLTSGVWTSPQVGDKRFIRWYERFDIPDSEGDCTAVDGGTNSHHPQENGNGGSDESWEELWAPKANGTVNWRFNSVPASSKWDLTSGVGTVAFLTKSVWYRFEVSFLRTGVNAYTLDLRVYDASGVLVYDKNNIRDANGLTTTLASQQGSSPGWFTMTDANIDKFQFGTNGGGAFQALSTTRYSYLAAVCLRSDDWCGAYNPTDR